MITIVLVCCYRQSATITLIDDDGDFLFSFVVDDLNNRAMLKGRKIQSRIHAN